MSEPQSGELFLGRLKNGSVTSVRAMSEAENQRISSSLAVLRAFHRESQAYEHVSRDYDDLKQYAASVCKIIEDHGTSPDLALDVEVELNRRVMALLSWFRAFLDHTAHALSKAYGPASRELQSFKTACSAEYDCNFAYRFSYKLRNYSQHLDLPIGQLTLRGQGRRRQHNAEVTLLCVRDQLLTSGFDWGTLVEELRNQPESWNVHITIDDLMPSVDRIRSISIAPQLPKIVAAAHTLAAFAKEAGYPDSQPVIVRVLEPVDGRDHVQLTLTPQYHATEILKRFARTDDLR